VRDDAHAVDTEQHRAAGHVGIERRRRVEEHWGDDLARLLRLRRRVEHAEDELHGRPEGALERLEHDVAGEPIGDDDVDRPVHQVAPLDVALEARHLLEQRERALAQLVALPGLLAVREQPDRGLVHRQAGARVFTPQARELGEPFRGAVDRRPTVDEQLVAGACRHGDRDRDCRTRDPAHAAHAQQRRRHGRARVPGADHRLRASFAHGLCRTNERRVLLAPRRRSRVLVHRHDVGSVLDVDARASAVGKQRLDRILLPDEQHVDAELRDGVERAADDLARGVVAAHGVDRDGDALAAHAR
jgi:hypothetical protein